MIQQLRKPLWCAQSSLEEMIATLEASHSIQKTTLMEPMTTSIEVEWDTDSHFKQWRQEAYPNEDHVIP